MLLSSSGVRYGSLLRWEVELDVTRAMRSQLALAAIMLGAVLLVAGLAYWDAERESAAALSDFAQDQATLAAALGAGLRIRTVRDHDGGPADVLAEIRAIERAKSLAILVRPPGAATLRTTDGREVASPRLIEAVRDGDAVVRIPREEAAALGLPARTALAGLAHVDAGHGETWDILAVATAKRERDRELWARRRLILSVFTAAGLVLAFGGLAFRVQRKELMLERGLALAQAQHRSDERLQRANRAAVMGTLAMGVAHEISTPLGVIAARAEQMVPRLAHDERLAASARAILSQTSRIDEVIRGLLGLARGDAPASEHIDPRAVVDDAIGLVEHRFAKAGVKLGRAVDPDLAPVIGDPRLLEHAVVNLLLNACEACKQAGEVLVRAKMTDDGVEISVEDSGEGISLADVGRALEPFFTTKAREGGTGLGLAIVHEIVSSHRGRLVFAEARPRGTRATIVLPRAQETAHA
jgi:two-component system NtrC family sensor kinase